MARFYVGDVVYTTDRWHNAGTGRPHLVICAKDGRYGIVPLTHTRQGNWVTEELGGGTYLAAVDFRTGRPTAQWATDTQITLGRRQLADATITAALAEYRRATARR